MIKIKTNEIPKRCYGCRYNVDSCYCSITHSEIDRDFEFGERLMDCPIKEDDTAQILESIKTEIAGQLKIMSICNVQRENGVTVETEDTNQRVVKYDLVMEIIDKHIKEVIEQSE